MHCTFCGYPLTTTMRFCPFCGTKIMTTRSISLETPATRSMSPPMRPAYRLVAQDVVKRPTRRWWRAWVLILLTLSLLVLLLLWLLNSGS